MEETVEPEKETEQNQPQQATEQTEPQQTESQQEMETIQDAAEAKAAEQSPDEAKPITVQVPLAPRCENPIIGRKVFFVNPPMYVENYLHFELKQNEYEAYIIRDYRYAKNALRQFPDALCFIFIDDVLSYDGWFNFIESFQKDEKLKTIFVGLMSAIIPKPQMERFIMNLSLPGGLIMLNECKGSALIEKIVGILELNGAKGRRKYLRLDCDPEVTINGYFANQSALLQVSIVSISSIGFTCYFPRSYGEALKKNMLVPSFSITIGRRSIVTPSVVFEVKIVDATRCFAVLLFLKQVGVEDRKVIKAFIFEQLEKKFNNLIQSFPPDIEDYSNRGVKAAVPETPAAETPAPENTPAEKPQEAVEEAVGEAVEEAESVESSEESKPDKSSEESEPAAPTEK